ncbi:DNA polymerase III subunit beta [Coprothermobacter platensis]|uniref:DNA polymerase III subunit beta n=1 Tax=Coprothermobacter platensis TaxID=108819 RepID=UPI000364A7BB|nr:DNA polymerase III subunit beta [Coprothermobacter platensis]
MAITLGKEELIQSLDAVLKHVPKKTTQPVLYNILLESTDQYLKITGTDMKSALSYKLSLENSTPFKTTVPAKFFSDFIRKAPGSDIQLSLEENALTVSSATASLKLSTLPPEDYPELEVLEGNTFTIDSATLKKAVDAVKKNVSKGELRNPVLEGILLDGTEGVLIAVGTDGHRLAACKTDIQLTETACLPADVLSDVCDTLVNTGTTAYVTFGEGEVSFENEVMYAVVRTLEGQFPPWRSVIPKNVETNVSLSKKTLSDVLDRAGMLAKTYDDAVRLSFESDSLVISAEVPELGSFVESIPVEKNGADLKIACNYAYLQDVLSGIEEDGVMFGLTSPLHPIVVRPQESELYVGLVMPMKI